MIQCILSDEKFPINKEKLVEVLEPKNFIGFAPEQTVEFLQNEVQPILEKHKNLIGLNAELRV